MKERKNKMDKEIKIKSSIRLGLSQILSHQLIMNDREAMGIKIRRSYKDFSNVKYPMDLGEKKVTFEEFLSE